MSASGADGTEDSAAFDRPLGELRPSCIATARA